MRRSLAERFWEKVNLRGPIPQSCPDLGPCWVWTGKRTGNGDYGQFAITPTRQPMAHRWAWEQAEGRPVADGMTLDHLCSNPPCVSPYHLEEVTQRENNMRSSRTGTETHCPHEHEFTPENTYVTPNGGRQCRKCKTEAMRRFNARNPGRNRRAA